MKIKIKELHLTSGIPQRAHYNDAGADVYYCEEWAFVVAPGQTKKIPLGITVDIPTGYMGVIHSKSGMSSKGITVSNAPIDAGYNGEIHAIIFNSSDKDLMISQGMKVGQLIILPVVLADFTKEEKHFKTRGNNGFGSTDKN